MFVRFIAIPALTMSVAWGLRGTIGGGPLGAMIPGSLLALTLCTALDLTPALAARVAVCGTVGLAFGGQETYGQTVGLVASRGAQFWTGLAGIGLKGAVWGLVGGAVLGAAFVMPRRAARRWLLALGCLVAGTALGWALIDEPKLLYFSNRLDRPRPELWAGLLTGGLAFAAGLSVVLPAGARVVWTFAGAGALGGGLGFAGGILGYVGGEALGLSPRWFSGWKLMEFTFGLLLGAALGWAALRQRHRLPRDIAGAPAAKPVNPAWAWDLAFAAAAGGLLWFGTTLPVRFEYTLTGAILLAVSFASARAAWQITVTATVGAFLLNVARAKSGGAPLSTPAIAGALGLAAGTAAWTARRGAAGADLVPWATRLVLWSAVGAAWLKALRGTGWSPAEVIVLLYFAGGALAAAWLGRRRT
jgi:hypothetical protein